MKTRVITSVVGIAVLAVALLFFDTVFFNLVIAGVTLIAIHEAYNAFKFSKDSIYLFLGFVPITLLVMFSDYVRVQNWLKPAAYIFVLYLAICVIINFEKVDFARMSGFVLLSAVSVFCFYSLIHLKSLLPKAVYGDDAVYFLLLMLGYAWGGDTFAFFAGSALGKHKLAPKVSPKKTWEGAVGGVLGSMLVGLIITIVYQNLFRSAPILSAQGTYYVVVAGLGAVASVLGILGDLFASVIKRQNGIKDYGTIFPGHGGILDRFDSVLFVAPFVSMAITAVYYRFTLA